MFKSKRQLIDALILTNKDLTQAEYEIDYLSKSVTRLERLIDALTKELRNGG